LKGKPPESNARGKAFSDAFFLALVNHKCHHRFVFVNLDLEPGQPDGVIYRRLRESCGISQHKAAKALGITQGAVSKTEKRQSIQFNTLKRLAHSQGATIKFIVADPNTGTTADLTPVLDLIPGLISIFESMGFESKEVLRILIVMAGYIEQGGTFEEARDILIAVLSGDFDHFADQLCADPDSEEQLPAEQP
jgi:transcriptional regulator with XRE-family HTH domain